MQFAYLPNRSTEEAVTHLLDIITEHLDRNTKNYARCLFIDFTSAFNTILPITLIDQLLSTNLNAALINLLFGFLTLSPVLFSIYIQHLPTPATANFHMIKYADDVVLVELLTAESSSYISEAATTLSDWCTANHLLLNVNKTKEMIIHNKSYSPSCQSIELNGNPIETVSQFKYLGTIIDTKLDFAANSEAMPCRLKLEKDYIY